MSSEGHICEFAYLWLEWGPYNCHLEGYKEYFKQVWF